ncbi:MAG: thermopsin family protease [Thermoplasmata archaeon]
MRRPSFLLVPAIVVIIAILAAPGSLGGGASARTNAPVRAAEMPAPMAPNPSADARISQIERTLHQDGVPAEDIHLPNFPGADPGRAGVVAPSYTQAPAPMGVADLGLRTVGTATVPYVLNTTSVVGTTTFDSAQSVYLDGDGPDMFGVQMNAVATHVTLFGRSSYEFWAQDYMTYTSSNGTLTFGDNVWNFSNPAAVISSNVFFAHGPNGVLVAPVYYFAAGPSFHVAFPFTVKFDLNATTVGRRAELFFNYSISAPSLHTSGSFDHVVFNSLRPFSFAHSPVPQFQANGTGYDPLGLPNDLELDLCGSANGDTTTFVLLHALFSIATLNASATIPHYEPIPSAYDTGSDTGESSNGVGVFYNATDAGPVPVAILTVGPSFLYGLWNLSGTPGYRTLSATITPINSFLFVTPGTAYNANVAQWAPTLGFGTGPAILAFPNGGNYYFEWLLSDYRPVHRSLNPPANGTAKLTVTMARENALGVYTPLIAWGDPELAALTASGAGTAASPYVLEANQYHPISAVFGAMNYFFFPVFPGILLVDTNATVHIIPPSLAIAYPANVAANLSLAGLPPSNHLQVQFWEVRNVTLEGGSAITGWLSSNQGFDAVAEVMFWDSTGNLVAGNTFYDQGISLAFYGGSDNTVWGNSFLNSTAAATNQSAVENSGSNTTGIWESESGDLIYNNYFALPAPAYTPVIDPLSCESFCRAVLYRDAWNVSYEPADVVLVVLGTNLSGSIIGTTYQGGNYWSNYGTPANPLGVLPYNDGGRITFEGDYHPLVRSPAYPVAVDELGLAAGAVWGVEVSGIAYRTNLTVLTVYSPNGTYNYTVLLPNGYTASASGNFTVNGTGTEVTVTFTPLIAVTFLESGVLAGWSWNVTLELLNSTGAVISNVTGNSTNGSLVLEVVPGTYDTNATSYGFLGPPNGTLDVGSVAPPPQPINFTLEPILTFDESGLPAGTPWTVLIARGSFSENFTSVSTSLLLTLFELPSALYDWNASAAGYTVTPSRGLDTPGEVATYDLSFTVVRGTIAGTVNVASAEVWIDGVQVTLTNGAFSAPESPGIDSMVVVAAGYRTYFNNVTVTSGKTTTVPIVLIALPTAPSSTGPAGISDLGWTIIGALAVVAAIGLLLAIAARRQGRAPPPPTPYSGTSAPSIAAVAPAARPPWQEDADDTAVSPPSPPR